MKVGQAKEENRVLYKELKEAKAGSVISQLPEDYYSISFSLELYRGLAKYLSEEQRKQFVVSMRMILDRDANYYKAVENEPAFINSFLRDADMDSDVLRRGRRLLLLTGEYYDWEHQQLEVSFTESEASIKLDFSCIRGADGIDDLPSGVIAFIGHNGCGKSTALYQIAKVLYVSPSYRRLYKKILLSDKTQI